MFPQILLSTLAISLLSLLGIISLAVKDKLLKKVTILLVSLSAGALLGGAFFHLIPESVEELEVHLSMILVIAGFLSFFLIEKVFYWRHCHNHDCTAHSFGYINLIGDTVHNFIDGLIIAAAFISDINLGVITTIAVGFHEIPQELGDFGVLLHSGMTKKKAILYNFLTATTAILGGVIGFLLSGLSSQVIPILLPLASGGFIYISSSDLIPEIHKENDMKKWFTSFLVFVIGIILMFLLTFLE